MIYCYSVGFRTGPLLFMVITWASGQVLCGLWFLRGPLWFIVITWASGQVRCGLLLLRGLQDRTFVVYCYYVVFRAGPLWSIVVTWSLGGYFYVVGFWADILWFTFSTCVSC